MQKQKFVLTFVILFSIILISGFVDSTNSGVTSIWTTKNDCGDSSQDVNQYSTGDYVFVDGTGIDLTGTEYWTITGTPGSSDPNIVVANGTIQNYTDTSFCFNSYEVQTGDEGVYKVDVEGKNDNYQVVLGGNDNCTDSDGDGYYIGGDSCGVVDCNDYDVDVNPSATEICNQVDDNCNAQTDEGNVCLEDNFMECPLNSSDYDYVFPIYQKLISNVNDNSGTYKVNSSEISLSLASGNYEITLVSADNYSSRTGVSQPNEQFALDFMTGGDELITSPTDDLTDNVAFASFNGVVESSFNLPSGADSIKAVHYKWNEAPTASPNSLEAICVGINKLVEEKEPYCGNEIVEDEEECDDGNHVDGDGCSAFCEIEPMPFCSIDYLDQIGGPGIFNLSDSIYVNQTGDYYVYGNANPNSETCTMVNVGYNRTSNGDVLIESWAAGESQGIPIFENWRTDDNDDSFEEGWHEICCLPTSKLCSDNSCDDYIQGESSCQSFCIDETDPVQVGNITFENPSECVAEYINEAPEFSWEAIEDDGCAPIHYEVALYFSNGTLITTFETNETSYIVPEEYLVNGENYYIQVRAADEAGNIGTWSSSSEDIYYDTENPQVSITGENWFMWYNHDFNVLENDTDNLGLYSCEYRILDDGNVTKNWTDIICGTNVSVAINITEYCPTDGYDTCEVEKRVVDNACNLNDVSQTWDLDRVAPETNKTVGELKVNPFGNWINMLINGFFVKDSTPITLNCDDSLSGCNISNYTITYTPFYENETYGNSSNIGTFEYTEPFKLEEGDGLYNITYWSVDNAGNVEEAQLEVDKVDLYAPETSLSFTGLVINGPRTIPEFNLDVLIDFIAPSSIENPSIINLTATDSEVGVNKTYYQILVPSDGEGEHDEWYSAEANQWYESYDACDEDNNDCEWTSWELSEQFLNLSCGDDWCEYNEIQGVIFTEECDHKICYYSGDKLDNIEDVECTVFSVDGQGPLLALHNPDTFEASSVEECSLDILVEALDEKVGIDEVSGIYATLKYLNGTVIGVYDLDKYRENGGSEYNGSGYETVISTDGLEAGDYNLIITSVDILGNTRNYTRVITLEEGIFLDKSWTPSCSVGEEGGICELEFRACVRGSTAMDFYMGKINDDLVSTLKLNGQLIIGNNSGFTGLLPNSENQSWIGDVVPFNENSCQIVNGRKSFVVSLNFTDELVNTIGDGSYDFDYEVNSYLDDSCVQED